MDFGRNFLRKMHTKSHDRIYLTQEKKVDEYLAAALLIRGSQDDRMLHVFLLAEPGSGVVEEIVGDVFIYAVPAEMDEEHTLYLPEDKQRVGFVAADETLLRHVILMKLIILCVVVLCRHGISQTVFVEISMILLPRGVN